MRLVVPVVRMSLSSREVVRVCFMGGAMCVEGLGQGIGGLGPVAVSVSGCPVGVHEGLFLHAIVLAASGPGPSFWRTSSSNIHVKVVTLKSLEYEPKIPISPRYIAP